MSLRRPNGFISAGFNPLEVPNAPTIGTATSAGPTSVSVTFTAPSNVGGSAITGYVATARKTSDGTTISGTGSSSPVTISGLTTGTAIASTISVPADATLIITDKTTSFYLLEDKSIGATASAANDVVVTVSWEEIT